MKIIPKAKALNDLRALKDCLREKVARFETKAQPCSSCETPGVCCLDEHFVNVRISRLEAVAIVNVISRLPAIRRAAVTEKINNTTADLTADPDVTAFACPLYEKGTGCLVHNEAKPVPCIIHACYASPDDLPPDELQDAAELAIDKLNTGVYARSQPLEPLPVAVSRMT